MLKFIRRNASGAWVKVMFLAIVAVFLFWGIGAGIGGSSKTPYVARVNGERIEEIDFQRALNNLPKLYQETDKEHINPELLKQLDLKGRALDQLVRVNLLRQEAERRFRSCSEFILAHEEGVKQADQNAVRTVVRGSPLAHYWPDLLA